MSTKTKFNIEKNNGGCWVRDGEKKIFFLYDIIDRAHRPEVWFLKQPDKPARDPGPRCHFPNVTGLSLGVRWRVGNVEWEASKPEPLIVEDDKVTIQGNFASRDGQTSEQLSFTIFKDKNQDYRINARTRLVMPVNQRIEFLNLYVEDMGNCWPEKKLFTSTVQEVDAGEFMYRPHSHLTVMEYNYWLGDAYRKKDSKTLSYNQSHLFKYLCRQGLLFFEGASVVPALRLIGTSMPVNTDTCDMWYDEHLSIEEGVKQDDGRYLYEAEYELFDLGHQEAKRILDSAKCFDYGAAANASEYAPVFCNRVNKFDAPASRLYDGAYGVFFAEEKPAHLVSWDRRAGYGNSGALILNSQSSIRPPPGQNYQAVSYDLSDNPWIELRSMGFSLDITEEIEMRFSAMIRVEGPVKAWIEMRESVPYGTCIRNFKDNSLPELSQLIRSPEVTSSEWKSVSGRIKGIGTTRGSMIFLCMQGKGRAFFSDLSLFSSTLAETAKK